MPTCCSIGGQTPSPERCSYRGGIVDLDPPLQPKGNRGAVFFVSVVGAVAIVPVDSKTDDLDQRRPSHG
eukprot:CAMPEP_0201264200 /NCGR_PEP_ID=MMETSP0853-20130426/7873_1 /ASSEMBLY_ACC=CAM_ASM_000640 /TAXON_ID=183588 /ORGANISM="Pseudo-nitzschia fraudulenta, Strain WWA7" /LENGTH=68 /DNA_ID=CAMNT_0047568019 /DNA_START=232 /DNA_END=434 /DNA_ORIENTATION=-